MPAYKGFYSPRNPQKYIGDHKKIVYRSSWEKKCMKQFDFSSDIIAWSSEEIQIPYISPKDGRPHRYYPDFFILRKNKQGEVDKVLIEVKPFKETIPPKAQGKKRSRFLYECITYEVNQAKWKAAEEYCKKRGWLFVKMTEKEIY